MKTSQACHVKTYRYCCAETDPSKSSVTKRVTVDSNSISASNKNGESRQIISVHFGNFGGRCCPRNFWQQRFLPGTPNPVKTAVRMWLERLAVSESSMQQISPSQVMTWKERRPHPCLSKVQTYICFFYFCDPLSPV